MATNNLREMIDLCEARIAEVKEGDRAFVTKLMFLRDKYGDSMFVTPRQRGYLMKICAELRAGEPTAVGEKPKSNLEKLKEKRAKLLRASAKRRKLKLAEEMLERKVMAKVEDGELDVQVTGRVKHERSIKLENQRRKAGKVFNGKKASLT